MTNRMDAVDHTHPTQDAVADAYRRGRRAADLRADGAGEASDGEAEADADGEKRGRVRDVSHASTDGTNGVWVRGEPTVRDDDE